MAVNSLKYADQSEDETTEPYEAAERSALQLWNALDDFRTSISKGKKRKVIDTDDISTAALWGRMELHEKRQVARRKQVLEKVCILTHPLSRSSALMLSLVVPRCQENEHNNELWPQIQQ